MSLYLARLANGRINILNKLQWRSCLFIGSLTYADIGAGRKTELTWQAKIGGGYHFNKFTGTFGFRYLRQVGFLRVSGRVTASQ